MKKPNNVYIIENQVPDMCLGAVHSVWSNKKKAEKMLAMLNEKYEHYELKLEPICTKVWKEV